MIKEADAKDAKDEESWMILQLRRIFHFDEQKARDSNALKELKILLRHHTPQSLHGHGKEFDEIFESLVHDKKIQLGNYDFLYDAVSKIDKAAALKIKHSQTKINDILKEDSNYKDTKIEPGIKSKTLTKEMEDLLIQNEDDDMKHQEGIQNLPLKSAEKGSNERIKSEFRQSLEREVDQRCENFKTEMEGRFLKPKHSTQAQVAIENEDS